MKSLRQYVRENDLIVVGHRGSSGTAPENTLAAFREAVSVGAHMVETDVQITTDGHVIAFHDKGLCRTTNGNGFACENKLEDFRNLDAGSWFHPRFSGEKVPLLREILETINDKAYINIEIKAIKTGEKGIEEILDVVSRCGYLDKVLFSSFYYDSLAILKKACPDLPTAAIRIPRDTRLPSEISSLTGCDGFVCSTDEINQAVSDDALAHDMYIGVYSIDTPEQLMEMLKYRIKAIVTNYPARIVKELDSIFGKIERI